MSALPLAPRTFFQLSESQTPYSWDTTQSDMDLTDPHHATAQWKCLLVPQCLQSEGQNPSSGGPYRTVQLPVKPSPTFALCPCYCKGSPHELLTLTTHTHQTSLCIAHSRASHIPPSTPSPARHSAPLPVCSCNQLTFHEERQLHSMSEVVPGALLSSSSCPVRSYYCPHSTDKGN